jgi:predicted aspartyl protease
VISGIVVEGHPIITVLFRIPNRSDIPIEFVIATGFTDQICLPPEAVALLGLPFRYDLPVNLASQTGNPTLYRFG